MVKKSFFLRFGLYTHANIRVQNFKKSLHMANALLLKKKLLTASPKSIISRTITSSKQANPWQWKSVRQNPGKSLYIREIDSITCGASPLLSPLFLPNTRTHTDAESSWASHHFPRHQGRKGAGPKLYRYIICIQKKTSVVYLYSQIRACATRMTVKYVESHVYCRECKQGGGRWTCCCCAERKMRRCCVLVLAEIS